MTADRQADPSAERRAQLRASARAARKRKRDAGLVPVECWVPAEQVPALRECVRRMCDGGPDLWQVYAVMPGGARGWVGPGERGVGAYALFEDQARALALHQDAALELGRVISEMGGSSSVHRAVAGGDDASASRP